MHWKGISAFGVRRFGEKKPIELDLKLKSKNERKVKKSGCEFPTQRESKIRIKAQATIKYSLMVELG
jgi:hypothetical protein